jgi:hypothetical protein
MGATLMESGLGLIDFLLVPLVFIGVPLALVWVVLLMIRRVFGPREGQRLDPPPYGLVPEDPETGLGIEALKVRLVQAEERAHFAEALLEERARMPERSDSG